MLINQSLFQFADLFYKLAKNQPIVMYHGTSVSKLPAILSQGLIPFPKERAWKEDPDASWYAASRQSLGGIYLTTNLMTAVSSGSNPKTTNKEGKSIGLIIAEINPATLTADEDDFLSLTGLMTKDYVLNEWGAARLYMDFLLNGEGGSAFQSAANDYVKGHLSQLKYELSVSGKTFHPAMIKRLEEVLKDGFLNALRRKVAYVDNDTWRRAWYETSYRLPKEQQANIPAQPNKGEAEAQYAAFIDQLTKTIKMKHQPNPEDAYNYSARSLHPIGYGGSSKIVAALIIDRNYDEGKRDEKGNRVFQIKVLYPGSWSAVPEAARNDFVSQWRERMGSQIEFDPA
jgi:hypothetical protein